jgi:hypothetical protein
MISLVLTPINARFLIRVLSILGRHSQYGVIHTELDENQQVSSLNISGIESASLSENVFVFPRTFFVRLERSLPLPLRDELAVISFKLMCRLFKNISPNKIESVSMTLSDDAVIAEFKWRNGLLSRRTMATSILPDSLSATPVRIPSGGPTLMTFSPRYIQGLLNLIPDSPTLWALTISTVPVDSGMPLTSTSSHGNTLYFSNTSPGQAVQTGQQSSVVELSTTQVELNRNASFFSKSECMY